MANYPFLKLLKDKKVADSYQFFDSCCYQLYSAEVSYKALVNVVEKYHKNQTAAMQKVFSDARKTGTGKYKAKKNIVDYMGVEISVTVAMDKLTMEIMSLLHNFFDTFAQWINSSLFGERALPIKKASLVRVIKELPNYPEYTGQFIDDFINLNATKEYLYISDFNNTLKHRYQIYVNNKFDLFAVKGEISIPSFCKDGRLHEKRKR